MEVVHAQTRKRRRTFSTEKKPSLTPPSIATLPGEAAATKTVLDHFNGRVRWHRDEVSLPPNFYELVSTLDGTTGSKGLSSEKELEHDDAAIRIDSLDIHTSKEQPCLVAVYVLKEKASH
eukprot:15357651-Ditylum_brightwellii.AAC.1